MRVFSREIEVESDDETLYQSKRSSQIKRDQHSSLPDLTEAIADQPSPTLNRELAPSSSISSSVLLSPISPHPSESSKRKSEISFTLPSRIDRECISRQRATTNDEQCSFLSHHDTEEPEEDGPLSRRVSIR